MEILLSVILPIYNVEKYLERCVNSIYNQQLDQQQYEVIFVDDGSTDGSGDLAELLAQRFINSRVIHKKNGGLSSARNAGMEIAVGKYIFMIDSDDWIENDTFLVLKDELKKDADIYKFNAVYRPSGNFYSSIAKEGIYSESRIKEELLPLAIEKTGLYILSAWSHVYKNSFIKENNLEFVSEREIGSEDFLFNIQALLAARKVVVLKKSLYNYDFREGSLTNRYRKNLFKQYIKLHSLIWDSIIFYEEKPDFLLNSLSFSYIEKFINVCLPNEWNTRNNHSIFEAWINTHEVISSKYFRNMSKKYPYSKGKRNRIMILLLLRCHIVLPIGFMVRRKI